MDQKITKVSGSVFGDIPGGLPGGFFIYDAMGEQKIFYADPNGHIVQGAVALGVQPLQEGVETKEHLDFLSSIGCDRAQGYYFSKPMPLNVSREYTREKGLKWE